MAYFVNTVLKHRISEEVENFLTRWATVCPSRRILHHRFS